VTNVVGSAKMCETGRRGSLLEACLEVLSNPLLSSEIKVQTLTLASHSTQAHSARNIITKVKL
jgi:hypothetical protein